MVPLFITIRFLDIIDILLFAILLYQVYQLIKGTAAINIFAGVFAFYLVWLFVKALNMHLLSSILGQFIGVGVIALIIVFQPELRKGLLLIGTRNISNGKLSFMRHFASSNVAMNQVKIDEIITAVRYFSKTKTGALIVIKKIDDLDPLIQIKESLLAETTSRILMSIFIKESPLHDGAVIISGQKILYARSILPLSEKYFEEDFGTRHRAAFGISEQSDAIVVVVSEETGEISFVKGGKIKKGIEAKRLQTLLRTEFVKNAEENKSTIERLLSPK